MWQENKVGGHLSTVLIICSPCSCETNNSLWFILKSMNTWFLTRMSPKQAKKSQKQPPDNTNKQVCSYSGDAGGGEEKKGRRCQEKGNKFLNKLNYTLNPPRPPLPRRSTFLALSFHFAASLFLPPPTHTHTPILQSVSVSPSMSRQAETGRLLLCLQSDTISS